MALAARGRLGAWLAVAAALLAMVAGQVQALVHDAEVAHVACAEHAGALEDVSVATAHGGPDRAHVTLANPAADPGHRACALPTSTRPGVAVLAALPAVPPPVALLTDGSTLARPADIPPGRSLLHLAPKLSPPTV